MSGPLTAGDPISDFALTAADGNEYSSADARLRGLLLFAFYKAGCGTCQYTFPFLQRFHDQYTSDRFHIWGVSQEKEDDTIAFADRFAATFPQLLDSDLAVSAAYGLTHVPGLYLVDETDRILRNAPAFDADELNAMARLVADRTGTPYSAIVRPEDNAPAFRPG